MAGAEKKATTKSDFFRQNDRHDLLSSSPMMPLYFRAKKTFACLCMALMFLSTFTAFSQSANYYSTNGTEYSVVGSLLGDQFLPDVAISKTGGFVVWQDNVTDGSGWGISASRIDSTLSGTLAPFRVNVQGTNNQENPRVALLKDGGAAFVWQGGAPSQQHIFGRFLTPTNTFLTTNDLLISTSTNCFQVNPVLTVLNDSNIVVVWSSYDQAGSNTMEDVYAKILTPVGLLGNGILVNQFTNYNQRTPAVAALTNGGFVVTWVSEQERSVSTISTTNADGTASATLPSIDIYARIFDQNGDAQGNEFLVNTNVNPCAHPSVASASDGSFMIVWDERDMLDPAEGLDVFGRIYSAADVAGNVEMVNTYVLGDQYSPKVSALAGDYMVVWTSLGQDGSREGVYGQYVHDNASFTGSEFRVNTTTVSSQMQPVVASDGSQQFLVVWTSFIGSPYNFDLFAQRYINASAVLQPMSAPFVWVPFVISNNVYQPQLALSWPPLLGLSVSNYEVYVDGATSPVISVTNNQWIMTAANGLTTNATHAFQLDYVTSQGLRSPLSPAATGTTWSGLNWGGVPYEWMVEFFGGYINGVYYTNNWPKVGASIAPGGPTLVNIFNSGGNPLDSSTWLQQALSQTRQGLYLSWNTQPGATYQVMVSTDFVTWANVGAPRFAAGTTDSIYVGGSSAGYYKVALLR